MFVFATLIGIYSYILFLLGIIGLFYKESIIIVTLIFVALMGGLLLKNKNILSRTKIQNKLSYVFIGLLFLQVFVNFIGVLGPELGFDALWYHLTLPKLYLLKHTVEFIPGGLLYYSAMPKLGEMLYAAGLSFGNEITVKAIHFSFGIFSCLAIYLFSRKYFSQLISIVAVAVFYSNIVVAWESTTAYIELIRTFFEILALWSFTNWYETKNTKWLYTSATMTGLAVTTKLLAFSSSLIFTLLIAFTLFKAKKPILQSVKMLLAYWSVVILIPLPWLIFSYIHTGNPVYPFFSNIYHIAPEPLAIQTIVLEIWNLLIKSADPISPLYLIFIPLIISIYPKLRKEIKILVWYATLALLLWYFTPRTGGGRFIIPYLPAFSIVCAAVISFYFENKKLFSKFLLLLVLFVAIISILYRGAASVKYIPVIIGQQTKQEFLSNNLNFAYGDFYDTDEYFKKNITSNDRVLLYGFHNLYYVDFPFIDSTWIKKGDSFNYIATQKAEIPERFRDWQLIHSTDKTTVKIYRQKTNQTVIF